MARLALLALAAAALAGCQTTTAVKVQCLPMAAYTPAQQTQASAELGMLQGGSELAQMIVDYGKLRAANRACAATPTK